MGTSRKGRLINMVEIMAKVKEEIIDLIRFDKDTREAIKEIIREERIE